MTTRSWLILSITLVMAALACNAPLGSRSIPTPTITPSIAFDVGLLTPNATATVPPVNTVEPTSTPTLPPGITPSPTPCTYGVSFIADVTIPDGTEIEAGKAFDKTWRLQNSGCLAWPAGTQLVFVGGNQMGGPAAVNVPPTAIGAMVDVTVTLKAPDTAGDYSGYWQLRAPGNIAFGDQIFVIIKVFKPNTPTPTSTATPKPATATPTPLYTPFIGTWTNADPNTTGITKVVIRVDGNNIFVRMWGKCTPTDCDWGETSTTVADANDGILSLTWTESWKIETQQLAILMDGRLQVAGQVDYLDGRLDRNYTEYFVKSN